MHSATNHPDSSVYPEDRSQMNDHGPHNNDLAPKSSVYNKIVGEKQQFYRVKEDDWMEKEHMKRQSILGSSRFFVKHSCIEVKRRKCHFCLAFCSVMIVVLATLVVNTIVDRGPVIFLRLSEGEVGEIDGFIMPEDISATSYLNYTRVEELYPEKYNISPRKEFLSVGVLSQSKVGATIKTNGLGEPDRADVYFPGTEENEFIPNLNFVSSPKVTLQLIDTNKEAKIKIGREYDNLQLKQGECRMSTSQSLPMGIKNGDWVYLNFFMGEILNIALFKYKYETNIEPQSKTWLAADSEIKVPCKVQGVFSNLKGKVAKADEDETMIMEIGGFMKHVSKYLPGELDKEPGFKEYFAKHFTAEEVSNFLVMTLPSPRVKYYENSDYDEIQLGITKYANNLISDLGFFPVSVDMPILEQMLVYSYAILFLGLIFNIVIFLFIIVSVLLIYSLLMISVETKTFEIGVMRMIGLSKSGLIMMILIQAFFFVFPSIICAFSLCFVVLDQIYTNLFLDNLGIKFDPVPSGSAVAWALFVGIFIPMTSGIIPVRVAMSKNLNEALDYQRSKTNAVYIQILDPKKKNLGSLIAFGVVSCFYGFAIYYFLPLSLLSLNFGMILTIFFLILLGMLLGLVLLALNIQRLFEIAITHVILFFETKSMKSMILKNLSAHRLRNRLTTIIYALSLGFMIFLITVLQLEIQAQRLTSQVKQGADFIIEGFVGGGGLKPSELEPIMWEYRDNIEHFSYVTADPDKLSLGSAQEEYVSDFGRIKKPSIDLIGVSPFIFESMSKEFVVLNHHNETTGLTLGEQLYTARGSQGFGIGWGVAELCGVDTEDYKSNLLYNIKQEDVNYFYKMRPIFTTNLAPGFFMNDRSTSYSVALVSIPMYAKMLHINARLQDLPYHKLIIKMKEDGYDANLDKMVEQMKKELSQFAFGVLKIKDSRSNSDSLGQANIILTTIFNVIIAIIMFLCFFSLTASMTANIYEQTKEIAVLRAIGFTKRRVIMLYIYEAFLLVFSSSIIGICIGVLVGWTMMLQRVLFTQIPLVFYIPYAEIISIFVVSIICSFLSTFGPARAVVKRKIAQIFRMNQGI